MDRAEKGLRRLDELCRRIDKAKDDIAIASRWSSGRCLNTYSPLLLDNKIYLKYMLTPLVILCLPDPLLLSYMNLSSYLS